METLHNTNIIRSNVIWLKTMSVSFSGQPSHMCSKMVYNNFLIDVSVLLTVTRAESQTGLGYRDCRIFMRKES